MSSKRRPARAHRVNYTDMLVAPGEADGGGLAGARKKRRAADEEDSEDLFEDMERPKQRKRAKAGDARKRSTHGAPEATSKAKAAEAKSKVKAEPKGKPKVAKAEAHVKSSSEARSKADAVGRAKVARKSSKHDTDGSSDEAISAARVKVTKASNELDRLRSKSDALREYRETQTDLLLKEAQALASEEKKTYEALVAKLKKNIIELSSRLEKAEAKQQKRANAIRTEHDLCNEALEREQKGRQLDNDKLQKRIRDLEEQVAKLSQQSTGPNSKRYMNELSEATETHMRESVELQQAKKLLGAYRLITSTELQLIEGVDDDDGESENYTDVACAVVDFDTGKRFQFDLAIPHADTDEIEYAPSDPPSTDFRVPSYLTEELSFKRSELTKFMRTLLDMAIKKKKDAA